jgi:uncharacterized protein (UPF0276 family)
VKRNHPLEGEHLSYCAAQGAEYDWDEMPVTKPLLIIAMSSMIGPFWQFVKKSHPARR